MNVLGDAMGTGIVQHLSRDDLQSKDEDAAPLNEPDKNNIEAVMNSSL